MMTFNDLPQDIKDKMNDGYDKDLVEAIKDNGEIVSDPYHTNVYAFQCTIEDDKMHLIWESDELYEVEYFSWPPTNDGCNF